MSKNAAEDIVEGALNQMKKNEIIAGFLKNKPSDQLDQEGIDFLIFLNNGLALPLQVKTSSSNRNDEVKKEQHFQKHPAVQFIVFIEIHSDDKEWVYRQIRKSIRLMVKEAMRHPAW